MFVFMEYSRATCHCVHNGEAGVECLSCHGTGTETIWRTSPLEAFSVEPCHNDRDGAWYRIRTYRDGRLRMADVSVPLGRRLALQLCNRYGIAHDDRHGLFCNRPFILRK